MVLRSYGATLRLTGYLVRTIAQMAALASVCMFARAQHAVTRDVRFEVQDYGAKVTVVTIPHDGVGTIIIDIVDAQYGWSESFGHLPTTVVYVEVGGPTVPVGTILPPGFNRLTNGRVHLYETRILVRDDASRSSARIEVPVTPEVEVCGRDWTIMAAASGELGLSSARWVKTRITYQTLDDEARLAKMPIWILALNRMFEQGQVPAPGPDVDVRERRYLEPLLAKHGLRVWGASPIIAKHRRIAAGLPPIGRNSHDPEEVRFPTSIDPRERRHYDYWLSSQTIAQCDGWLDTLQPLLTYRKAMVEAASEAAVSLGDGHPAESAEAIKAAAGLQEQVDRIETTMTALGKWRSQASERLKKLR